MRSRYGGANHSQLESLLFEIAYSENTGKEIINYRAYDYIMYLSDDMFMSVNYSFIGNYALI